MSLFLLTNTTNTRTPALIAKEQTFVARVKSFQSMMRSKTLTFAVLVMYRNDTFKAFQDVLAINPDAHWREILERYKYLPPALK